MATQTPEPQKPAGPSALDRLKAFGSAFVGELLLRNETQVLAFIRSYLVGRLEPVDAAMFAQAVKDNSNLLGALTPGDENLFRRLTGNPMARQVFAKYAHKVNVDVVLMWLGGYEREALGVDNKPVKVWIRGDRPDLWAVVANSPNSRAKDWLERQIAAVVGKFTGAAQQRPAPPPKIEHKVIMGKIDRVGGVQQEAQRNSPANEVGQEGGDAH